MHVEFEEESRIDFNRKQTLIDKIARGLLALGLVRSRRAAQNVIVVCAFLILIASFVLLYNHQKEAAPRMPGVDFTAPIDPAF